LRACPRYALSRQLQFLHSPKPSSLPLLLALSSPPQAFPSSSVTNIFIDKGANKLLKITVYAERSEETLRGNDKDRDGDKERKIKVVRTIGGRRRIPESEIKRILRIH